MVPRCFFCPGEPPLALMVRERDVTWDGRPVIVLIWTCPVCENGRIARERRESQPTLPLDPPVPDPEQMRLDCQQKS